MVAYKGMYCYKEMLKKHEDHLSTKEYKEGDKEGKAMQIRPEKLESLNI
jgi:hypothetical protein